MTGQIARLLSKLYTCTRRVGVGVVAGLIISALTVPAYAQTTTYSENFTFGTDNNAGDPQVDNWEAFRDGLTATYSNITVGGSEGPNVSCSDPAAVAAITSALNTDATATIACEGRDWNVGTCVGSNELSVDVPVCTCQAASDFTLRPDVDFGGSWGGIGGTCGTGAGGAATQNVSQVLTVSVEALGAPTDADLSLIIQPASTSPTVGANTFIDVEVANVGPATATGVTVDFALPSGLTFISDDSGGAYNSATGVWTLGTLLAGSDERLRIIANVASSGSYLLEGEVASANENDNDSTPGNAATVPGEDDSDSVTLTPVAPPPPLFCLGRPIQPLVFANPVAESPGASLTAPQVGDVFRFGNASPGVDVLVEVTSFNNGASLAGIDNDGTTAAPVGVPNNFQPTLVGPAGDVSVDFRITIVSTGTTTPGTLDFAGSVIDVDGDGGGLREYIEVSDNIVEFALNGTEPPSPATRLISQATSPPGPGASAPSASNRVRFEAATDDTAAGIDPDEPRNIAAAFFTDVAVFEYRIGKFGDATTGRLNSLAFNCPNINPGTTGSAPVLEEDFGDVPFDASTNPGYGNPIHVIDPSEPIVQLGAANTAETTAGNDPAANSDAGDDGITIRGASLQGASFARLTAAPEITVNLTNASSDTGLLQAFFDWNIDGDFTDPGEQVAVDVQDTDGDGVITLNITPPAELVAGTSFARFRWATSSVDYQEAAGDGEAEDYQITLLAPELAITKTASEIDVLEGTILTYTLEVTETAGVDAADIVITDQLPAGLTFVSANDGGVFDGTDTISWTLPGPLNASVTASLSVSFEASADPVTSSTDITNTASVTSTQTPAPVTDGAIVTVNEAPTPPPAPAFCTGTDLAVNGGFEAPDVPGTNAFALFPSASVPGWTATTLSGGATQIELWDSGHAGVVSDTGVQHAELNATDAGSLTTEYAVASRAEVLYFWAHRARNNNGETASLLLSDDVGGVTDFGDYSSNVGIWNTFAATHVTGAGATTGVAVHTTEETGSVGNFHDSIQICQTFITLAKAELSRDDVDGDGIDSVGDRITYRYTISNPAGNERALASVVITDDKIGTLNVPTPDSGDTNSDNLLDPGETWVFDADYALVQADLDAGEVTNIAFAEADTSDNTLRTDDQTVTVFLSSGGAELSGVKTVEVFDPLGEGLFALPGNDVTYTITVTNIGAGNADDDSLFLIDELPDEVVFFNGDADGPGPGTEAVNFEDVVPTGLDPFVFADSVRFAGAGPAPASFADCTLLPDPGYDPDIRYVCFNPKGVLASGDPDPEFNLSFRVRIR